METAALNDWASMWSPVDRLFNSFTNRLVRVPSAIMYGVLYSPSRLTLRRNKRHTRRRHESNLSSARPAAAEGNHQLRRKAPDESRASSSRKRFKRVSFFFFGRERSADNKSRPPINLYHFHPASQFSSRHPSPAEFDCCFSKRFLLFLNHIFIHTNYTHGASRRP